MNKNFVIKDDVLLKYTGFDEIVTVPEGIKEINKTAFYRNEKIKEIILPNTVVSIGSQAFDRCFKLEKINLENIKKINQAAFFGCKKLKNIELNNIEIIGRYAFSKSGLEKITLPEKLKEIEVCLFSDCKKLKEIEINCNFNNKPNFIFDGCKNVKKLKINNNCKFKIHQYGILRNLKEIEINNPLYKIKDGMIYSTDEKELIYCPPQLNIKEYIIPDTVLKLEQYSFSFNENISKIIFGKNIETVERHAFKASVIDQIIFNEKIENLSEPIFEYAKVKTVDMSQTNIKYINLYETNIYYYEHMFEQEELMISTKELLLPNKLEDIYTENNKIIFDSLKIAQPKEKFNKKMQTFIEKNNIQTYYKTLEELIESGKTFIEASRILKNQER